MPTIRLADGFELYYEVDDFTDPWRKSEAILLLHGNCESGAAWFAWVPVLARHLRVVRPDMRGYGRSTPVPRDFPWSIDLVIDDYMALMGALGIERFHLAGAKIGGFIARRFAARFPDNVLSLTLLGTPGPRYDVSERAGALIAELERDGVEAWARRTMRGRLGSHFPPEGVEWWIELMSRTATSTAVCFYSRIHKEDIRADLPRIRCPTLVITTEGSALGSVEETRAWQEQIPESRLLVLPGDSYHVAASEAERCAHETLEFIRSAGASGPKQ